MIRPSEVNLKRLGFFLLAALLAAVMVAPARAADDGLHAASPEKRAAANAALKEIAGLLKQASETTGLAIRRPVKSAVAGKEETYKYIRSRLSETATPQKLRAQGMALKKFGLLPAGFELESFMVKLLTEQATAYYDPQHKQIFISDWTPMTLQRPAIIHELVHALQDQHIGLDAFLQQKGLNQDEQMARAAVVEGAGVLAMMEYIIASTGMKRAAFPNLDDFVSTATAAEINKFPVYTAAPLYLRESLLFPYTAGMRYVRWRVDKEGKGGYASALKNPPRSTADVLHPGEDRSANDLQAPEVSPLPAGYALLDTDMLGELDVSILLKQFLGEETARSLAPAWRGLRYALYENGARTSAFLVHRSRWQDAEAAGAFAEAYRKVLAKKGEKNAQVEVERDTVTVREGVPAPKM